MATELGIATAWLNGDPDFPREVVEGAVWATLGPEMTTHVGPPSMSTPRGGPGTAAGTKRRTGVTRMGTFESAAGHHFFDRTLHLPSAQ